MGWYRLAFKGPPAASGRGWEVSFEEARKVTDVWLNGRYLGQNSDPYHWLRCVVSNAIKDGRLSRSRPESTRTGAAGNRRSR